MGYSAIYAELDKEAVLLVVLVIIKLLEGSLLIYLGSPEILVIFMRTVMQALVDRVDLLIGWMMDQ